MGFKKGQLPPAREEGAFWCNHEWIERGTRQACRHCGNDRELLNMAEFNRAEEIRLRWQGQRWDRIDRDEVAREMQEARKGIG
jgi:hypothetical protein